MGTKCILQFGYTIGTSSSKFNTLLQKVNATLLGVAGDAEILAKALEDLLANIGGDLRNSEEDLAVYPNPFNGVNPGTFESSGGYSLDLVDGGESGVKWALRLPR